MAKRFFFLSLGCYGVWCLLNWVPGWQALVLGIPVAILAAALTWDLPVETSCLRILTPRRFWYFWTWYFPVYWWECFKANLDVAYRVLHPKLPICPAVVRVQTGLKTDLALTVLANSISLTPGTTSIDVDQTTGFLYVHCMTVSPEHVDERARVIIERFAHILRRIYE